MRRWSFVLLTTGTLLLIYLGYGGLAAAILWFVLWFTLSRMRFILEQVRDMNFKLTLLRQRLDIQDRCIDDLADLNERLVNLLPPNETGVVCEEEPEPENKQWFTDSEWLDGKSDDEWRRENGEDAGS